MIYFHCRRRAAPLYCESDGTILPIPFLLTALKACGAARDVELGRRIHANAAAADDRADRDVFVASKLVDMYAKCGSMDDARAAFAAMREENVVAWTAMVQGFAENGEPTAALDLFDRMLRSECRPNARTFVAALKACVSLARRKEKESESEFDRVADSLCLAGSNPRSVGGLSHQLQRAVAIHRLARSSGFDTDVFVANTLVDLYAKCGSLDRARQVFQSIARPTVVSWTSIILGYVDAGDGAAALELFERMKIQSTCRADAHCLVAALKACSLVAEKEETSASGRIIKPRSLERTRSIHSEAIALGSNVFINSILIDAYAKCGSMADARAVFDAMVRHDVISWTSLIAGYAENNEPEISLRLFSCMKNRGCSPDARTFVAALNACSCLAALETGIQIHQELSSYGFQNDDFVANSLIDFYGKCGCMPQAEKVFHEMRSSSRGFVTWSSLIAGYSRQGDGQRVFDVAVNGIAFLSVLTACSHAGLVEQGRHHFETMVSRYSIAPEIEHYHCMVDLLGRANHLREALEMVTLGCRSNRPW